MFTCIIVDDEKNVALRLKNHIEENPQLEFEVASVFYSAEEAYDYARTNVVDLIITDIKMNNMSGLDLIRDFANDDTVETIIISGYLEFELARQAISNNVLEYLVKPIDFNLFDSALEKALTKIRTKKHSSNPQAIKKYIDNAKSDVSEVKSDIIEQAKKYIEENYNKDITLHSISSSLYLSPYYFSRIFTTVTGETFSNYLNKVRIEHSIELLRQQVKTEDISKAVGFSSGKYFVQKFKSYTGLTPIEYYRKIILKGETNGNE